MNEKLFRQIARIAIEEGEDAAVAYATEAAAAYEEADREAADALEHDDSEWADIRNGYSRYGEGESYSRNEAGEFIGLM